MSLTRQVHPSSPKAGEVFSLSQKLIHIARVLAPTLIALTFATVAHAQGTMDFTGATTLMTTFKTFAIYGGAVICFGGLIFAGVRMLSGRFQDAIPGLFGALFGAGVLGWGAGWIQLSLWRPPIFSDALVQKPRNLSISRNVKPALAEANEADPLKIAFRIASVSGGSSQPAGGVIPHAHRSAVFGY